MRMWSANHEVDSAVIKNECGAHVPRTLSNRKLDKPKHFGRNSFLDLKKKGKSLQSTCNIMF